MNPSIRMVARTAGISIAAVLVLGSLARTPAATSKLRLGSDTWPPFTNVSGKTRLAIDLVHEALRRECREELGCEVSIGYLSGVYYHSALEAHAAIFRCHLPDGATLTLSEEHSHHRYFERDELTPVQRLRVDDCLNFDGNARSRRF